MIETGSILFIEKFDYGEGTIPTDKLVFILCIDDENGILVRALPTSQVKIPDDIKKNGCTNNEHFSFFFFAQGSIIGTRKNRKPFIAEKDTFISIRGNVNLQNISSFHQYMPDRMFRIGTLNPDIHERLLKCVRKSKHLTKKIKKVLEKVYPNTQTA